MLMCEINGLNDLNSSRAFLFNFIQSTELISRWQFNLAGLGFLRSEHRTGKKTYIGCLRGASRHNGGPN